MAVKKGVKEKKVNLPAHLEDRPGDIHLGSAQYLKLPLFAQLKERPKLDEFPGTLVVRRYRQGQTICRQGEEGWTAFYILPVEDELAVYQELLAGATTEEDRDALRATIAGLQQRVNELQGQPADDERRKAAVVYLDVKPAARPGAGGPSPRPRARPDGADRGAARNPLAIPIDAPGPVPAATGQAFLREGELFGEMSCRLRSPRSATIQTLRDCLVVEMLRNILDRIAKDAAYKSRADEVFKKRVLELHIRNLSIFEELTDQEFEEVRKAVRLRTCKPGELICDEHERADSLYIVRRGLVKVMKKASALLAADDVLKWPGLWEELRKGRAAAEVGPPTASARLWQMLPANVQALVGAAEAAALGEDQKREIVHALNDVVRDAHLAEVAEFAGLIGSRALPAAAAELLARRKDVLRKSPKQEWPPLEARRFNRALLEALLPGVLRHRRLAGGPETILSYCAQGDYFGEMGLILRQPRSATCVTFTHPDDTEAEVELVEVPGAAFWNLVQNSPKVREKVDREIERRKRATAKLLAEPTESDNQEVQTSKDFGELGLVQGQKLMLIDLDRCTRCDECVQACVATHDDGRSRLFLDGPRFGKYLVPTTCRSCLDPVCMIGCPVGSIHRGDVRQIVIEDWCIGCGLCADNCPYGSILMHDLGIIPETSRGWHFLPAAAAPGDAWVRPKFVDGGWLVGETPFRFDRNLRQELEARGGAGKAEGAAVNFRYRFRLDPKAMHAEGTGPGPLPFRLEVATQSAALKVWINGTELVSEGAPRQSRWSYVLPQDADAVAADGVLPLPLCPGDNLLAIQVTAPSKVEAVVAVNLPDGKKPPPPLLQVWFDRVRPSEKRTDEGQEVELTEKLVKERAVVCDLCGTLPRQKPACVQACPHDAALRVNARFDFPTR